MAKSSFSDKWRFRTSDSIGAADAESDVAFLAQCYVDRHEYSALLDTSHPARILVGRTGSGKSAVLLRIVEKNPTAIYLDPSSLSMQYLTNSTMIQFLQEIGVKLDIVFKFLWRHIFIVELIKKRYGLNSEGGYKKFKTSLSGLLSFDRARREALAYIEEWGDRFWLETEKRVQEITEHLSHQLSAKAGVGTELLSMGAEGARTLAKETRTELQQRAQNIVDQIQMKKMADVMSLLEDEMLASTGQNYYIVIDRLDERWVDDSIHDAIIGSLIETARDFARIRHAKIIIAIRKDLFEHILNAHRGVGFQTEKYRTLVINIEWSEDELIELINKRVSHLIRNKYVPNKTMTWSDIAPKTIDKVDANRWVLSRSLLRPRDVIMLVNYAIQTSGDSGIVQRTIETADREYSKTRLEALADEWLIETEYLQVAAKKILSNLKAKFTLLDVPLSRVDELAIILAEQKSCKDNDKVAYIAHKTYADKSYTNLEALRDILTLFYKWGLIGIKSESTKKAVYSFRDTDIITSADITNSAIISVSYAYRKSLGIVVNT